MKQSKMIRIIVGVMIILMMISAACAETEQQAEWPQESPAEQAPWTGDGHWYTFQYIPSGLVSSTNQHYVLLPQSYYATWWDTDVPIGKLKGMNQEIRVFTKDPEERIIWVFSDSIYGGLMLSGVELPEPDMVNGEWVLLGDKQEAVISETAKTEALALWNELEASGEAVDIPEVETDSDIGVVCPEITGLRYWLHLSVIPYEDNRLVLGSWTEDNPSKVDRIVDIDPDSALYREYFALRGQE